MLLAALTGNIASGKSTVASQLAAHGAALIDSDVAARAAVAPGSPALVAIVERFGTPLLRADGTLDRAQLGRLIFNDPDARRTLEQIVHPAVEVARLDAIAAARTAGRTILVCDIPLLFEARLAWQFPRVVLVDAPESTRIARLMADRGMSRTDAAARVHAQLPAVLKRGRADVVLENDGDLDTLCARVDRLWRRLQYWAAVAESDRAA